MKNKKALFIPLLIMILLIAFFNKIINFIINVNWFKEVNYLPIYFTRIKSIIILMIPIFIIFFISIWIYYKSLMLNKNRREVNVDLNKKGYGKKLFFIFNFIVSIFLAYIFSSSYWYRILQFNNSIDFNVRDPIFSKDISFYVFKLPLFESLYKVIIALLLFLVITTFITYFILEAKYKIESRKDINLKNINYGIKSFAGKQLAIVSGLIILFISFGHLMKIWNLVYSNNGVAFGASYTDIHATLLFYKIIVVVTLISSIVTFLSILKGKFKPVSICICITIFLLVSQNVASFLVQNFIVKSNEKTLEQPYIKNNIDLTRKAFALDDIEIRDFDIKNDLQKQDIVDNKASIDNVRINSFKPTLEFYNQVQIIRYYYTFNDVDIDRYNIDGKYNQVFLAAREIDTEALNPNTWQNRHLIYTHGFGAVMNKVNSVTSEGQPDFVIKDIPPYNKTNIKLTNPRIYFGEKTNDYVIVNTKINEFDYPKEDSNKTNKYNGHAGIKMNFLNKVLFAINKKDINFLLSKDIKKDSKIIINRNIVERVKKIAPFLTYDSDPYMVIYNGKIYWIIDAYTTTNRYPYSEPYDNINYIRNSAKVVVDSVDGDVNFYITDKKDPIINSYAKIFKGIFKGEKDAPKEIREHFRYPRDLFNIQSKVLGRYHVKDPGVFYNGEDLWEVSKDQKQVEGETNTNDAPYIIMKLPEQNKEEMVLLNYFNVMKKDNMIALFGVRMDGDQYGKKILYKLPSDKTIYSPYLFKQKINQDTNISKELSLWNKEGSQVQYGDTIILPIKNSLLYIEPLYLRASGKSSIPEMKRVILSYNDKLVLSSNIQDGIKEIFDSKDNKINDKNEKSVTKTIDDSKLKKAKEYYDEAIKAQKNGDWTKYGENINKLGNLLNDIK
ncbi:UPF0182 family protein [Clostridium sporogenes]|uniref:UPF0182 protein EXM42_16335 n=1 Tax=Clostridium botulinum TaxID=1491 RepID=A0A6M0T521_CLOBO|nr:UPF0182 family protein [Clostridium sporogenes]NFA61892.1 UPF0182 family protein [Clostridium botulinum]NFI75477.1 UPF0182 family protein [Clostridium sporogenes]NFL73008.1 UPF0182 family protein [Clostridium sporogenes]NFM25536.1 UPF0182 family protein [Clostridium sporogenes]NFP63561.1 UPF0182 family protein [Clostridium sporogenes]